jgi:tetratricopeptide (TPR) repeat protein
MKRIAVIIGFLVMSLCLAKANEATETFNKANMLYQNGNFSKSAQYYEKIVNNGYENAEVFYNLGNAYFRMNKIPEAILNYERALRLAPDDDDIITNLNIADLRIVDKIEPVPKFFLVQWYEGIRGLFSSGRWSIIMVVFLWLLLGGLTGFFVIWSPGLKKLFFGVALVSIVIVIFSLIFASQQYSIERAHDYAIVFNQTVYVKSSPDEDGKDLFILHEGTKVKIVDAVGNWRKMKLANGNIGWLPGEAVEVI